MTAEPTTSSSVITTDNWGPSSSSSSISVTQLSTSDSSCAHASSSYTSDSASSECEPTATSLLYKLRPPTASDLSRKRKVHSNPPPPAGKKRSSGTSRKFDPVSVSPSHRASEFPNEELVESGGKLLVLPSFWCCDSLATVYKLYSHLVHRQLAEHVDYVIIASCLCHNYVI